MYERQFTFLHSWNIHLITPPDISATGGKNMQPNLTILSWKIETTFHYCWSLVKSSFKLVWMESTSPCNSLIGHSLKWRCCSLVWPISLLTITSFDSLKRDQSFFRLPAPYWRGDYTVYAQYTRIYTAVCTCYMSRGRQNNNGCPSPPFWRLHTFTLYFMTKQIWKNYSANCKEMRGRGVWCAHEVKHTYILKGRW